MASASTSFALVSTQSNFGMVDEDKLAVG